MRTILFSVILSALIFSCSKQSEKTLKQEDESSGKNFEPVPVEALDPDRMVPVGTCRVVGTVVSIDPSISRKGNGPCSKAPCIAVVRIDSVLGCGSGFRNSLSAGSSVRIKFAFTLAPSKDIFPQMNPPLPGLREGSKFKGLIHSAAEASGYSVDTYEAR